MPPTNGIQCETPHKKIQKVPNTPGLAAGRIKPSHEIHRRSDDQSTTSCRLPGDAENDGATTEATAGATARGEDDEAEEAANASELGTAEEGLESVAEMKVQSGLDESADFVTVLV